jgi:Arc/MetJ-type ribon-helix-helix transcriptional regulator
MVRTQIYLTEQEHRQLHRLSRRRGASLSELIRLAIDQMLSQQHGTNRVEALRQARGIWKNRDDLPDFGRLRREWDRTGLT